MYHIDDLMKYKATGLDGGLAHLKENYGRRGI